MHIFKKLAVLLYCGMGKGMVNSLSKLSESLTPRQVEVLELVKKGLTNQEICRFLSISSNTVKVHLANIYKALEVSNRTEAAMLFNGKEEQDSESVILPPSVEMASICFSPTRPIESLSPAWYFFSKLAGGIQNFEDIRVLICESQADASADFSVKLSVNPKIAGDFSIALYYKDSTRILWSQNFSVHSLDNADELMENCVIHLHNAIEKEAALLYRKHLELKSHWWFGVMYCKAQLEKREESDWQDSLKILEGFHSKHPQEIYIMLHLANLWYIALWECWTDVEKAVSHISVLANAAMRLDSGCQHSASLYSIYSNITQDYHSSRKHLEYCYQKNPLNLWAVLALCKVYWFTNQADKGLVMHNKLKKSYPEFLENPNNRFSEAVMLFMNFQYEGCLDNALKTRDIIPDYQYNRLLIITTLSHLGRVEEARQERQAFSEMYPEFSTAHLTPLIKGIHEEARNRMLQGLETAGIEIVI